MNPSEIQTIDARASALMKRGIRLMQAHQPPAVVEALGCFDRALELRSGLPTASVPALRYGLAACWLNRADALMRLGSAAEVTLALDAYDRAILQLRDLPLHEDLRFPKRLAIAFQNRGLALLAATPPAPVEAIAAFTEAISTLEHDQAALVPDRDYLLAVVWMNLANAHASEETIDADTRAGDAARRAIFLVTNLEARDADAAEAGLKARHIVCQTIARRLSATTTAPDETMPDDVHEATDMADDGLSLVRRWEQQGEARFRSIASDLFRFGARVYERYQPHFLREFVLDNLDPKQSSSGYVESPEIRAVGEEMLGG